MRVFYEDKLEELLNEKFWYSLPNWLSSYLNIRLYTNSVQAIMWEPLPDQLQHKRPVKGKTPSRIDSWCRYSSSKTINCHSLQFFLCFFLIDVIIWWKIACLKSFGRECQLAIFENCLLKQRLLTTHAGYTGMPFRYTNSISSILIAGTDHLDRFASTKTSFFEWLYTANEIGLT